jgi:S-formylglutathione hydrolase FrmB
MATNRLPIIATLGLLLLAPMAAPAAELQTFELPSELVDTSTPGGVLEDGRTVPKVHVLLPDGYRASSKRGYPVLWLLHGANGGTDTWIPGIATLAAGLDAIVVMPDGGQFGMYMDWWNGGVRGASAWSTYHLRVLRQEIDRRYRIRRGRRWHAIGGISMGGQGTLRYAAMLPGYFGSVVGFSAAFPDMQCDISRIVLDLLPVRDRG